MPGACRIFFLLRTPVRRTRTEKYLVERHVVSIVTIIFQNSSGVIDRLPRDIHHIWLSMNASHTGFIQVTNGDSGKPIGLIDKQQGTTGIYTPTTSTSSNDRLQISIPPTATGGSAFSLMTTVNIASANSSNKLNRCVCDPEWSWQQLSSPGWHRWYLLYHEWYELQKIHSSLYTTTIPSRFSFNRSHSFSATTTWRLPTPSTLSIFSRRNCIHRICRCMH
jgi:hypothetical protein